MGLDGGRLGILVVVVRAVSEILLFDPYKVSPRRQPEQVTDFLFSLLTLFFLIRDQMWPPGSSHASRTVFCGLGVRVWLQITAHRDHFLFPHVAPDG